MLAHKQHLYLCYNDPQAVKHAMCWRDGERWDTACGIQLGPRFNTDFNYVTGKAPIDIRDILMSTSTCMLCIVAEEGRPW